jgi:hypothetical protein
VASLQCSNLSFTLHCDAGEGELMDDDIWTRLYGDWED